MHYHYYNHRPKRFVKTKIVDTLSKITLLGLLLLNIYQVKAQHINPIFTDNLVPGASSSFPSGLTNINGSIILNAGTVAQGFEPRSHFPSNISFINNNIRIIFDLYPSTVGQPAGTGSDPRWFAQHDGYAYYFANDKSTVDRRGVLFRTRINGASYETCVIKDIHPGGDSEGRYLTSVGDKLYFAASNGTSGVELWSSDGKTLGETPGIYTPNPSPICPSTNEFGITQQIANINPAGGSFPKFLTKINMAGQLKLLFSADNGAAASNSVSINRELWVLDHNTSVLSSFEINGNAGGSSDPIQFIEYNDNAYFFARTSNTGPYQLFRFNGSTVVNLSQNIPNLVSATIDSDVSMAVSNGLLYFVASVPGEGKELWSFDGSVAVRIKDINPGTTGSNPTELIDINNTLFFAATTATNGRELWRSDGTSFGTVLAKDITAFGGSSNPILLTKVQDYLYFFANNQFFPSRKDLWVADPRILSSPTANNEQIRAVYRFHNDQGAILNESVPSEMEGVGNNFYFTATSLRPYDPGLGNAVGQEVWFVRSCAEIAFNYNSDPAATNTLCGGQGTAAPIITFSPNTGNQICSGGNCFSSNNPNLVINPNTGEIDLAATPANTTATITYIYKEGACRVVKTVEVSVQEQTEVTTNISTVAGSSAGYTNDIGTAARFNFGNLSNPVGILDTDANSGLAFSSDGTFLYVSDEVNHCIRKINLATQEVSLLSGVAGAFGGPQEGRFNRPTGMDVDAFGTIYVADKSNHLIRRIDPNTGISSVVAGDPSIPAPGGADLDDSNPFQALFSSPTDVAVAADGTIYIADKNNHKIRKIAPNGVVSTLAGAPSGASPKFGYVDGTGTAARFYFPSGIDIDNEGNIIVADMLNHRIRKITPAGVVTTIAGGGPSDTSPRDAIGAALSARFYFPVDVAVSPIGEIFITDRSNHKIKVLAGGQVTLYAGTVSGSANGPATSVAEFRYPSGVALSGGSLPYISDRNNHRIRKAEILNPTGELVAPNSVCGTGSAASLVVELINYPDEPDASRIVRWESSSDAGVTWTNLGNAGNATYSPSSDLTESTLYRAIVREAVCGELPSGTAFVEVNVPTPPTTQDVEACADPNNNPITFILVASGGLDAEYVWYDASLNNLNNPNDTLVVNINTSTDYFVSINKPGNCESVKVPLTARILELPTPAIVATGTACAENTQTYRTAINAGNTYTWTVTNGVILPENSNTVTAIDRNQIEVLWNSSASGVINLREENAAACAKEVSLNVVINPLPTPVITSVNPNTTVCADEQRVYNTPLVAGHSYTWTVSPASSATIVSGENSHELTVIWLADGELTVTESIDATACEATSSSFSVTVSPLPTPVITGENTVCLNDEEIYNVALVSGDTYSWNLLSGGVITSPTDANEVSITWNAVGTHTLEITQTNGSTNCSAVSTFEIEVGDIPSPVITGDFDICESETASYSITATSNTIEWTVMGGSIRSGQGSNIVSIQWDADISVGEVSVTETNPSTLCSSTATESINLNAKPEPSITGAEIACQNSLGTYSVPAVGADTYTWTVTGGTFTGQGTSEIEVTWGNTDTAGIISITQTNAALCDSTLSFSVSLIAQPDPSITGIQVLCAGETATYTTSVAPAGQTYIYNWTITGLGTILSGQGTNQVEIQWDEMIADPTYLVVDITVQGTGCTSTTPIPFDPGSFAVTLNPLPTPVITSVDNLACEGEVITYFTQDPLDATHTYNWTVTGGTFVAGANPNEIIVTWGSIGTGAVNLTEISAESCETVASSFQVDIQGSPTAPTAENRYLCDTSIDLDLTASEPSASDYNWYTTETEPVPFQNGASITVSALTATTSYWVSAINAAGCEGPRAEVSVELNPATLPWTIQGITADADSCITTAGDSPSGSIELSVSIENPPYTYQWSKDEDAGFSANTSTIDQLTQGTYRVTVTDAGGCSQAEVFTIVEELKQIEDGLISTDAFIENDTIIVGVGDSFALTASATDALTYSWLDEAGNEIGTEAILNFDNYNLDSQLFTVIITNDRNCSVSLSIYVKAVLLEVFVPKMFSPNGDSNNEYFRLYGNGIKSVNLRVFNRLGELVYQTDEWVEGAPTLGSEQIGWDGSFNGKPLPSDGYIWSVKGRFVNNKEITFNGKNTGDVLLVR